MATTSSLILMLVIPSKSSRHEVRNKNGVPVGQQRLVDKQLGHERRALVEWSTVFVMLRLLGGMQSSVLKVRHRWRGWTQLKRRRHRVLGRQSAQCVEPAPGAWSGTASSVPSFNRASATNAWRELGGAATVRLTCSGWASAMSGMVSAVVELALTLAMLPGSMRSAIGWAKTLCWVVCRRFVLSGRVGHASQPSEVLVHHPCGSFDSIVTTSQSHRFCSKASSDTSGCNASGIRVAPLQEGLFSAEAARGQPY